MKNTILAVACIALAVSGPVSAATDMGLTLHQGRGQILPKGGVGVQMRGTVRLGGKKAARVADRVTLGLNAGPMLNLKSRNGSGAQRITGNMLGFHLQPGRSYAVAAAGLPLAGKVTRWGAAQDDQDGSKGKKKGLGSGGWVAVGVGAVVIVGGLALLFGQAISDITCNNCDE